MALTKNLKNGQRWRWNTYTGVEYEIVYMGYQTAKRFPISTDLYGWKVNVNPQMIKDVGRNSAKIK